MVHPDLHPPEAAPARYFSMRIAIRGPYSGTEVPSPSLCAWLAPYLRVNKTPRAVFVLQTGVCDNERRCNAKFCEELKHKLEELTDAYPSEQGERPYRVELLEEKEWVTEWERSNML